ncbi:MAG: platelet-activating factor acetylhydrolase IB subunit [Pirellulales bacterium]
MNARPRFIVCLVALVATATTPLFAQPATAPAPPTATVRDTVTPAPRDANWIQRHELINSRAVPGAVDLIFIGDSITQGWEGEGKQAWDKFYGARKAMNAGISGDRTQHVLWRLDNGNVNGITPKVAVVMIGTNNAAANEPADTAAGIEAVVRSLRQKLPGTKVLLLGVFPRGATLDDPLRKKNTAVNEHLVKLDDGKDVFYLDIGPNFLAADGTLAKEIMPDLLHLSPRGYEIWAEAIEPQVKELLGGS